MAHSDLMKFIRDELQNQDKEEAKSLPEVLSEEVVTEQELGESKNMSNLSALSNHAMISSHHQKIANYHRRQAEKAARKYGYDSPEETHHYNLSGEHETIADAHRELHNAHKTLQRLEKRPVHRKLTEEDY